MTPIHRELSDDRPQRSAALEASFRIRSQAIELAGTPSPSSPSSTPAQPSPSPLDQDVASGLRLPTASITNKDLMSSFQQNHKTKASNNQNVGGVKRYHEADELHSVKKIRITIPHQRTQAPLSVKHQTRDVPNSPSPPLIQQHMTKTPSAVEADKQCRSVSNLSLIKSNELMKPPTGPRNGPNHQPGEKIYYSKWLKFGQCSYFHTPPGCKFKHEIPPDKADQKFLDVDLDAPWLEGALFAGTSNKNLRRQPETAPIAGSFSGRDSRQHNEHSESRRRIWEGDFWPPFKQSSDFYRPSYPRGSQYSRNNSNSSSSPPSESLSLTTSKSTSYAKDTSETPPSTHRSYSLQLPLNSSQELGGSDEVRALWNAANVADQQAKEAAKSEQDSAAKVMDLYKEQSDEWQIKRAEAIKKADATAAKKARAEAERLAKKAALAQKNEEKSTTESMNKEDKISNSPTKEKDELRNTDKEQKSPRSKTIIHKSTAPAAGVSTSKAGEPKLRSEADPTKGAPRPNEQPSSRSIERPLAISTNVLPTEHETSNPRAQIENSPAKSSTRSISRLLDPPPGGDSLRNIEFKRQAMLEAYEAEKAEKDANHQTKLATQGAKHMQELEAFLNQKRLTDEKEREEQMMKQIEDHKAWLVRAEQKR